jgi:hypothetical protein
VPAEIPWGFGPPRVLFEIDSPGAALVTTSTGVAVPHSNRLKQAVRVSLPHPAGVAEWQTQGTQNPAATSALTLGFSMPAVPFSFFSASRLASFDVVSVA